MGAKEFASTTLFESLPPMQFAKVLTIVVLVVAATVAQQEVPDAEFEMAPAWGDSEDISLMESPAQANKRILKNIREVIAFAQGAKEKAFDMTEGHVKVKIHTSPIVRIVLDLAKKSKMKNIVLRYVHDMERAQADFPMGIGHYVLNHLHRAIIKGKGAVRIRKEGDHYYAKFTHRALGLQALPAYVDTLKELQKVLQRLSLRCQNCNQQGASQTGQRCLQAHCESQTRCRKTSKRNQGCQGHPEEGRWCVRDVWRCHEEESQAAGSSMGQGQWSLWEAVRLPELQHRDGGCQGSHPQQKEGKEAGQDVLEASQEGSKAVCLGTGGCQGKESRCCQSRCSEKHP